MCRQLEHVLEKYFGSKGIGKGNPKLTRVQDDTGFIQKTGVEVNALFEQLKADSLALELPKRGHDWTF